MRPALSSLAAMFAGLFGVASHPIESIKSAALQSMPGAGVESSRNGRRPPPGRGNAAVQRAARKRRNVQRNRRAQRGFALVDWIETAPACSLRRAVLGVLAAFWLLVLLAFCAPAEAADRCPVGLMVGSVHFDPNREDQLSGVNPGAYVLCEGWAAGAYRDSRRRPAAFAGMAWHREGLALVVGAKATRDGIEPALIGSIRMGPVRVLATPPWGRTPAALALAVEF